MKWLRPAAALSLLTLAFGTSLSAQKKPMVTPWGEPDLQGTWTNATITPLERPANLADKPFLTAEEVAAMEQRTATQRDTADERPPRPGDVGTYNQFWTDSGTKVVGTRQASLWWIRRTGACRFVPRRSGVAMILPPMKWTPPTS
jgi:hypothetical protein